MQNMNYDYKKIICFTVIIIAISSYILHSSAISLPALFIPSNKYITVIVKATGVKNSNAKASEVWFYGIKKPDGAKVPWSEIKLDPSWEVRNDALVSYHSQPSIATWEGTTTGPLTLCFGSGPYSGEIEVTTSLGWNFKKQLYSSKYISPLLFTIDPYTKLENAKMYLLICCSVTLLFLCIFKLFYINKINCVSNFTTGGLISIVIALMGILVSLLTFYPGWMSADSFLQYSDVKAAIYNDWHPPLMAWWWRIINSVHEGPALFLIQNLVLYWGAWCLFALASHRWLGRYSYFITLVGFWPGILFPLGQIWKDISFAASMFFAWAVLLHVHSRGRKMTMIERAVVFILGLFAFGVKTNGLVALPFLFGFWVYVEGWFKNSLTLKIGLVLAITFAVVISTRIIVPKHQIIKTHGFQYTQTYDLLAISVKSGKNLLPSYITGRVGSDQNQLKKLYFTGGNNLLFYNTCGNIMTTAPNDLAELNKLWLHSIFTYPGMYWAHRRDNFFAQLCWGEDKVAYVASPAINNNPYGFQFIPNKFSDILANQTEIRPWLFFPWIYMVSLIASSFILLLYNWNRVFVLAFSLSAIAFVLPHLFILPASDYRYLYYSYFVALLLSILAFFVITGKIFLMAHLFFKKRNISAKNSIL